MKLKIWIGLVIGGLLYNTAKTLWMSSAFDWLAWADSGYWSGITLLLLAAVERAPASRASGNSHS